MWFAAPVLHADAVTDETPPRTLQVESHRGMLNINKLTDYLEVLGLVLEGIEEDDGVPASVGGWSKKRYLARPIKLRVSPSTGMKQRLQCHVG